MEREYWSVIAAGTLYGTVVSGGQVFISLGLSLYEISLFSLIFGFLLLPLVAFKGSYRFERSMTSFFLIFGAVGAVIHLAQFGAVILGVPVAIVVLLLYTQPLWTLLFSRLLLHEGITRYKIVAMMLVLVGVMIILDPFSQATARSFSGLAAALIGGISLSVWVVYGRKGGIREYPPVTTTCGFAVFSLLFLALSYPALSLFVDDPSFTRISFSLPGAIWLYLFVFALVSNLFPNTLFFYGVRRVPAASAGIILLLEPVGASVFAVLLLGQPLTSNILLGGALILLSNYLTVREKQHSD